MPTVKKQPESKSLLSAAKKIDALYLVEDAKRKKRDKTTYLINGGAAILTIGVAVIVPAMLVVLPWLVILTLRDLENNRLRWQLGMQRGLHNLERVEIDKLMVEALTAMPKATELKKKRSTK